MKRYRYRTLFYLPAIDKHLVDNVIGIGEQVMYCWRALSPQQRAIWLAGYSHEEIWTPDKHGWFGNSPCVRKYVGTCYTSTKGQAARGKNNVGHGTCKRGSDLVLKHPERWHFIEWEVDELSYLAMIAYLETEVRKNKGYGLGPNKNICSEIGHNANVTTGVLGGKFKVVTPMKDAILQVKAGGIIQKLGE